LYHQNPADIDEDTIILVIMIQTQFHHTVLLVGTKCNDLTADRPFYSAVSAFKISTPVDVFIALDHQNPTNIDEDTTILVIILRIQFCHVPLFVVRIAITQQPLAQFSPPDRR
jgi:hypothetical protein